MNSPQPADRQPTSQPAVRAAAAPERAATSAVDALDQRPGTQARHALQQQADASPRVVQRQAYAARLSQSPRLQAPAQRPAVLPEAARSAAPVQRVIFSKKNGETRQEEDDDYVLQDGEEEDYEALDEYYRAQEALEESNRLAAIAKGRSEKQREAEAQRLREEQAAKEAEERRLERERGLRGIPLTVTRKDRNFASVTNSRGQGKAHLTDSGLAPAGDTSISSAEQLDQESTNKGTSDLISFTGPRPRDGGQDYGGGTARSLTLKLRKLARARAKGKPDAQNLDVITSADLLRDDTISRSERLRGYARKDDEHQVRVRRHIDGTQVIPKRFIHSPGLVDETHDSDSDEDS